MALSVAMKVPISLVPASNYREFNQVRVRVMVRVRARIAGGLKFREFKYTHGAVPNDGLAAIKASNEGQRQ